MQGMPQTLFQWISAIIFLCIGAVVGYLLPWLVILLPLILIVMLWQSAGEWLFGRIASKRPQREPDPTEPWMWQAPAAGVLVGLLLTLSRNGIPFFGAN